jgi:hypothetical protein
MAHFVVRFIKDVVGDQADSSSADASGRRASTG